MQRVCVESGTHLVQERLLEGGGTAVQRLVGTAAPR
jgi:hypothetical protein